jgi:hypothetical protein
MKNILTILVAVSLVVFLSGASASAQGKGPGSGSGASVGQGHGQENGHDHDQAKTSSDAKADHDSHSDWQTKFNERLQNNPTLASRVDKLLAGTDLKTAESGFKNGGQFIAALHVSKNLGIPFDQLKAKMTGINGQTGQAATAPMSLGKAIHELKPTLSQDQANDEAKRGEKQATETEKNSTKTGE